MRELKTKTAYTRLYYSKMNRAGETGEGGAQKKKTKKCALNKGATTRAGGVFFLSKGGVGQTAIKKMLVEKGTN